MEKGCWNNNETINKTKANKIAKRLQELIDSGEAKKFELEINKRYKKAKEHNNKVRKQYPQPIPPEKFNKYFSKLNHNENYPFSVENVKEFIEFCENSHGFEIS